MKRSLIYGGVFSFAACSFLFSSCSADKEELESMMDGKSSVSFTAVIDEVSDALRASWLLVDPGELNPDYSKPELFGFEEGDKLVALSQGKTETSAQENIKVSKDGHVSANLYSNGKTWFFYPSTNIFDFDTAKTDVNLAKVQLNIKEVQSADNQHECVFLKTDPIDVVDGKISTSVRFNHLTSLLRFHVLNQSSNKNFAVSNIKLTASSKIFPTSAIYKFASQETMVQKDMNLSGWVNVLEWNELSPAVGTQVNGASMSGYIYDALLVTLPIDAEALANTTLTVSVTFKDLEKKSEFTPTPITYDGAKLAAAFPNGWANGKRSYFNIRFNQNNELLIGFSDSSYPGDWGSKDSETEIVE